MVVTNNKGKIYLNSGECKMRQIKNRGSKATIKKTSSKRIVKKPKKVYDCEDVEGYLDRAILDVKKEINKTVISRIEEIDIRDRAQFAITKEHIGLYASIVHTQDIIKTNQAAMESEIVGVGENQKRVSEQIPTIKSEILRLHDKIDTHLVDQDAEFKELHNTAKQTKVQVETIQQSLDNVSVNGNKGLAAAVGEIAVALRDLKQVTEGARARAKFWAVLHNIVATTPFLKPLKYKWGVILYATIFLLLVNTILRAYGIEFDLWELFKWLLLLGKTG